MTLHVIGGKFRGRVLKGPKGDKTRPTSAMLRKSVFDICMPFIEGARFLDLFAGSGAMGLEALSRGASHATFVEHDRAALQCIQSNIALVKVESDCTLVKLDVQRALKKLHGPFDIIYIDPPYDMAAELPGILAQFDQGELVAQGGIIFLEEGLPPRLHPEKLELTHLVHWDSRKSGRSLLHQYRKKT